MTTTETAVELGTLSALDLKALRLAESVSFHKMAGEKTCTIVCNKRAKNPGPFDQKEVSYEVATNFTARVYDCDGFSAEKCRCFDMIHTSQYDECWQTTVAALKAGDVLTLEWVGDCNQYTKDAKLHSDKVYLVARRHGKKSKWLVGDCVCPNNSARMIKP